MENYLVSIGKRIRDERKNHNWLISQLAEKAELSVAHVSSIERGRYNFSVISLINIANALDLDINYLLFGAPEHFEHHHLQDVIEDCNMHEASILLENAKQLKSLLRKENA